MCMLFYSSRYGNIDLLVVSTWSGAIGLFYSIQIGIQPLTSRQPLVAGEMVKRNDASPTDSWRPEASKKKYSNANSLRKAFNLSWTIKNRSMSSAPKTLRISSSCVKILPATRTINWNVRDAKFASTMPRRSQSRYCQKSLLRAANSSNNLWS